MTPHSPYLAVNPITTTLTDSIYELQSHIGIVRRMPVSSRGGRRPSFKRNNSNEHVGMQRNFKDPERQIKQTKDVGTVHRYTFLTPVHC